MSNLETQFAQAQQDAQALPSRPSNDTMLALYAHYKQATQGDTTGKRPGFTDFVGRAKYDAWSKLKGMEPKTAMQSYIDMVAKLKGDLAG